MLAVRIHVKHITEMRLEATHLVGRRGLDERAAAAEDELEVGLAEVLLDADRADRVLVLFRFGRFLDSRRADFMYGKARMRGQGDVLVKQALLPRLCQLRLRLRVHLRARRRHARGSSHGHRSVLALLRGRLLPLHGAQLVLELQGTGVSEPRACYVTRTGSAPGGCAGASPRRPPSCTAPGLAGSSLEL